MPPSVKDEVLPVVATPPRPAAPSTRREETSQRPMPVALEVEVTVNGARTVAGSGKREPFSETTKTILVFGNGAVIRLFSTVAPGQLLFLTNAKTKKEVVCQVVKSKNYRSVSGYVELEFTEPVTGFWGVRFPGDPIGAQQAAPEAEAPAATIAEAQVAAVVAQTETPPAAGVISAEALQLKTSRLHDQLASLLFTETPAAKPVPQIPAAPSEERQPIAEAASRILAIATSEPAPAPVKEVQPSKPAPPLSKPAFQAEELKIPAWLEPLARNVAAPASTQELVERKKKEAKEQTQASEIAEPEAIASPVARMETPAPIKVPNFGSRLLPSEAESSEIDASGGTNKGLLFGAMAAVVMVLLAGGAWYLRQSSSPVQDTVAAAPSASVASAGVQPKVSRASSIQTNPPANFNAAAPSATSSAVNAPPAAASRDAAKAATNTAPVAAAAKKPELGQVRLAAPTVNRNRAAASSAEAEPSLDVPGEQAMPDGDVLGAGLAVGITKQPAAPSTPLPAGGDVKPARLLSSVVPAYPMLAKAQRAAGDVRIDALVDATGYVTTMKVVSGPALLHQAAMEALRQWKYQPATLDGKPVAMHMTVTIQFRLQQ